MSTFGYSAQQVAELVDLPRVEVHALVRAGYIVPERGARGALRFSFQDLVLLRAARALLDEKIPARRVRRALGLLRARLPVGRPLSSLHISAHGNTITVRDGSRTFEPESGQSLFDFSTAPMREGTSVILRAQPKQTTPRSAAEWFAWGCEIEIADAAEARRAYEQAILADPAHADALVNLGRLYHEAGEAAEARRLYERALEERPEDSVAVFNLGVALEDLGVVRDAITQYRRALRLDPGCADAHYNLARLYERGGEHSRALRHLGAYRRLVHPTK
ncbi:MAG: tetratricopeptide repeat protein [Polyangia bacterium]